jgi:hypothetical protein
VAQEKMHARLLSLLREVQWGQTFNIFFVGKKSRKGIFDIESTFARFFLAKNSTTPLLPFPLLLLPLHFPCSSSSSSYFFIPPPLPRSMGQEKTPTTLLSASEKARQGKPLTFFLQKARVLLASVYKLECPFLDIVTSTFLHPHGLDYVSCQFFVHFMKKDSFI